MKPRAENNCYFANSRGILKSSSVHSSSPISDCKKDAHAGYLLSSVSSNAREIQSFYVCSTLLTFFVSKVLPLMTNKFVLVSGDSDAVVPKEVLSRKLFNILINHPLLIKWFAQNTRIAHHPKITQLPIGIDFHTISNNHNHRLRITGEPTTPVDQEKILLEIRKNMKPFHERYETNKQIYVNFNISNDRFGDRNAALNQIPSKLMAKHIQFTPRTQTWHTVTNFAFVLSPFGFGMDCHRTWETLCLGAIPIVRNVHFNQLFEDLPVLIVSKWSDVTAELLDQTIQSFRMKQFNYDKLTLKYWTNQIYLTNQQNNETNETNNENQ